MDKVITAPRLEQALSYFRVSDVRLQDQINSINWDKTTVSLTQTSGDQYYYTGTAITANFNWAITPAVVANLVDLHAEGNFNGTSTYVMGGGVDKSSGTGILSLTTAQTTTPQTIKITGFVRKIVTSVEADIDDAPNVEHPNPDKESPVYTDTWKSHQIQSTKNFPTRNIYVYDPIFIGIGEKPADTSAATILSQVNTIFGATIVNATGTNGNWNATSSSAATVRYRIPPFNRFTGNYTIKPNSANGSYIYFYVPKTFSFSKITMGGFDFPKVEVTLTSGSVPGALSDKYRVYRSANILQPGQITLNIA